MATILKENRDGTVSITQNKPQARAMRNLAPDAYDEIELAILTFNKQKADGVNEIHVDGDWVTTMVVRWNKPEKAATPKKEG